MIEDQQMEFSTAASLPILDGPPRGPEDTEALCIASRERGFIGIDGGVTGGALPGSGDVRS